MSRAKAIRQKCLDCCGFQTKEVRLCPAEKCPLWIFRMGTVSRTPSEIDVLDDEDGEEY